MRMDLYVACSPSHRPTAPAFYATRRSRNCLLRSTTLKRERDFHSACDAIRPVKKWVIYPGAEAYPLGDEIQVMPLEVAMRKLADRRGD